MNDSPATCIPEQHLVKELLWALFSTLVAPVSVLLYDYYSRSGDSPTETYSALLRDSGPDACILSLGGLGAAVVDPHFRSLAGEALPAAVFLMFLSLMWIRVACSKKRRLPYTTEVPVTYQYGVWSLTFVTFTILTSYMVALFK